MSSKSQTHTGSPPAASSRLRILTRWRSASALNTRSSSPASSSLSCGVPSGAQHWITGSGDVMQRSYRKNLIWAARWATVPVALNFFDTSRSADVNHANPLPVAVIGAGPVGLAAAVHLIERGLQPIVFERGAAVG